MLFWGILKTNKGKENFWKQRQIQQRKTLLDRTKQLSTFFVDFCFESHSFQCFRCSANRDRYHFLYYNSKKNSVLHCQLDIANGAD